MNHGGIYGRIRGLDPILIILVQSSIVAQPGESALNNPPPGQNDEARLVSRSLDNLNINAMLRCSFHKLTTIGDISPDLLEARIVLGQHINQPSGHCAILIVGFGDKGLEHQTLGIDEQVALAPFDMFTAIVAPTAPFSVVLTDWLSMIAALGVGSRSSSWRKVSRSAWFMPCHMPSLRQVL
jgi:hypothetical protein